jgi:uncharacterized membrane protein
VAVPPTDQELTGHAENSVARAVGRVLSWPFVTRYELLLTAHIVGAFLFFGGALVAGAAFEAASRRERPSEVALLLGLARVGAVIVLAGAVLVLGAGLWLASDIDQLGEPWLRASLALFVLALLLGALGGRRPKRARHLATELARTGTPSSSELHKLLHDTFSRAANYASSALVIAILVLMVVQPGR